MTTIPSTTIDATGVHVPDFASVLAGVQDLFQGIYGVDVLITPDTQDGQWLGVLSQALSENNQGVAAVYNAFIPTFAQGAGLSSLVKLNGVQRGVPTNSQIVVTVAGVAGTQIHSGQVGDNAGLSQVWNLPALVTIPPGGTVDVTATNAVPGAIAAGADSLTVILTPTLGWQTVTNGANAASLGAPVESDAALRRRQAISTGKPALTPTEAIAAEVANVPGVTASRLYENNTSSTDGNGIPGHSISVVVDGGDVNAVAQAIFDKIAPGIGTHGTTSVSITDSQGMIVNISFYELAFTTIYVVANITALDGYTSAVGNEIKAALVAWVNGLDIGEDVFYTKLVGAANLFGTADGNTFNLTSLTAGVAPAPVGVADIPIDFNKRAQLVIGNVTLNVT